jgi:anaerobilin synthase
VARIATPAASPQQPVARRMAPAPPPGRSACAAGRPPALATLEVAAARTERGVGPGALFDERIQTHHEAVGRSGGTPLSSEQAADRLAAQLRRPGVARRRAIYVHVPFCQQICSFCAFNRQATPPAALRRAYAAALQREVGRLGQFAWAGVAPVDAIYVGGGTPTALAAAELAAVLRRLRALFWVDDRCEITVETRCCDADPATLDTLLASGVNRLSFGVQSFDTTVRQDVGRVADQAGVLAALAAARQAGFAQISVDLIYNLPRETDRSWQRDLDLLAASPATAASVYALIAFQRSALQRRIERGDHPPLRGLETQFERFRAASQALGALAYWRRQSCVHFGDARHEQSVYNSTRGQDVDILGIGPGAGGQLGSLSYMNPMDIDAFVQAPTDAERPRIMASESPPHVGRLRRVFALSETGTIAAGELNELLPNAAPVVRMLERARLAEQKGDCVALTEAGCFWSYNIGAVLADLIRERSETCPCDEA